MSLEDYDWPNGRRRESRMRHMQESDEIAELGKTAIKGMVTVGTVAIGANLVGGMIGSMQKK